MNNKIKILKLFKFICYMSLKFKYPNFEFKIGDFGFSFVI